MRKGMVCTLVITVAGEYAFHTACRVVHLQFKLVVHCNALL